MKLKINKKLIEKHLDNVSRALSNNNVFPALSGILIIANQNNIQLIASNGNLSIKETINFNAQTNVEIAGKILVPGKLFKDIIHKQNEDIKLEVENSSLKISSQEFETKINLLDPIEFPTISFETIGKELIINSDDLNNLIKNVTFAAAENDRRIILNGVNLKASEGFLIATATNSFRLAQEIVPIDNEIDFNITIFAKNFKDLFPSSVKGMLVLKIDDNKIITSYESSLISSKLIDGIYPEITKLIPKEFEAQLIINSKLLIDLIDKATVIADENSKVVKLTINKNELQIQSRRNEIGDTFIKTSNFKASVSNYEITFNSIFLKEAISKFSDEISLNFTGQFKAFVIKSDLKPTLIQLILPHRTF